MKIDWKRIRAHIFFGLDEFISRFAISMLLITGILIAPVAQTHPYTGVIMGICAGLIGGWLSADMRRARKLRRIIDGLGEAAEVQAQFRVMPFAPGPPPEPPKKPDPSVH